MKVTIPSREMHEGLYSMTVEIADTCPRCDGPRGEPHTAFSYDGSRRLVVSGWTNPCGHTDLYSEIREEVKPGYGGRCYGCDGPVYFSLCKKCDYCPNCGALMDACDGELWCLECSAEEDEAEA